VLEKLTAFLIFAAISIAALALWPVGLAASIFRQMIPSAPDLDTV